MGRVDIKHKFWATENGTSDPLFHSESTSTTTVATSDFYLQQFGLKISDGKLCPISILDVTSSPVD